MHSSIVILLLLQLQLIFPDGLNPEEFEAQKPCSGRSSEGWW